MLTRTICRAIPATIAAVLALLVSASSAGSQSAAPQASCMGTLSSYSGPLGLRDDYRHMTSDPGGTAERLAHANGDLFSCYHVLIGG